MNHIFERIDNKKENYTTYDFTQKENNALKTFFDLAQEFDRIEDFYSLCVAIPKSFFNLEACLYILNPKKHTMALISKTEDCKCRMHDPPPEDVSPSDRPYLTGRVTLVMTIRGKGTLMEELPFQVKDDVLGLLEVYPVNKPNEHRDLFFQK
ncbi:MAG: hypothetical protein JSV11_09200, partial [Nitrospiraceae bacterium]